MNISTPQRSGPEPQELSLNPGTSVLGTGSSSMPVFPESRGDLLRELDADPRAADLMERLRPILAKTAGRLDAKWRALDGTVDDDKRAEACFREMQLAWKAFVEEREFLGSWPPHFEGLRLGLQGWLNRYAIQEAEEMLRPAARPEDDWRLQVCRWVMAPEGPRPEIPRWEIPCHTIPTWVEGRTWLTLLPAPYADPPYLPAVVELPPDTDLDLDHQQLRLKQGSMMLETRLMSVALTPPEESRTWLLRLAHLSQAAWIVMT